MHDIRDGGAYCILSQCILLTHLYLIVCIDGAEVVRTSTGRVSTGRFVGEQWMTTELSRLRQLSRRITVER